MEETPKTSENAPRVFLCHAREDKPRFVLALDAGLRQLGVDVWLDARELLPGDSLVDKIFEEGIPQASTVIVVLSKFSIDKPWVREELNAAVVHRISRGAKIIPAVLDGCQVPAVLLSTLWETVDVGSPESIQEAIERIAAAIHGVKTKAPIGPRPAYASTSIRSVPGLSNIDGFVLKVSCEHLAATDTAHMEPHSLFAPGSATHVPEHQLCESLQVLDHHGYVKIEAALTNPIVDYSVTWLGWTVYAQHHLDDFAATYERIVSGIVNEDLHRSNELAAHIGCPHQLVAAMFEKLAAERQVRLSKEIAPYKFIWDVSPTLKRMLERPGG